MPKEETCPPRSSSSLDKIEDRVVRGCFKQWWEDRPMYCVVEDRKRTFECTSCGATDRTTPVIAPDGARTTPADWFASTDFSRPPALFYVSETGETVFRTDALVERQRMLDATGLVLELACANGWSYQRFARARANRRNLERGREQAVPVDGDSRSGGS